MTISTGIITTIAGTGATRDFYGSGSYSGDNGQATGAALNYPNNIVVDSVGISDANFFAILPRLTVLFSN